jgi:hypothetical protein
VLGTLGPFPSLGVLSTFRTLDFLVPLDTFGALLALGSLRAVFAPVLAALDSVFPPILLTVCTAIFLAIRAAVGLAVLLPVSAAIFLADVRLRDGGGGAAQGQRGYGDCNDSLLPHELSPFGLERR